MHGGGAGPPARPDTAALCSDLDRCLYEGSIVECRRDGRLGSGRSWWRCPRRGRGPGGAGRGGRPRPPGRHGPRRGRGPRARCGVAGKGLQPRSLEVLDDLGVIGRIVAAGHSRPATRKYRGDAVLGTSEVTPDVPESTPSTPYPRSLVVPQWRVEGAGRGGAAVEAGRIGRERRVRGGAHPAAAGRGRRARSGTDRGPHTGSHVRVRDRLRWRVKAQNSRSYGQGQSSSRAAIGFGT